MNVFAREYVTIDYLFERKILKLTWLGAVDSSDFITVMDWIIDKTDSLAFDYLLIDTRVQGAVKKEATDYASSKMNWLFETNKLKAAFFVLPLSLYTQMSIDMFQLELAANQNGQNIRYFVTVDEALKNIPKSDEYE